MNSSINFLTPSLNVFASYYLIKGILSECEGEGPPELHRRRGGGDNVIGIHKHGDVPWPLVAFYVYG